MAASATMYHLQIDLSDVDRSVYQALYLRVARHPSETMRYLLTRVIAYCLCHEEGIAFSKGLSTVEEAGGLGQRCAAGRAAGRGAPAPEGVAAGQAVGRCS